MNDVLTIAEVIATHARIVPDRAAVKDSRRSLSYRDLHRRTCRLANALLGLGLRPGDRLAILAFNRAEWLELYAACACSGIVAVPVGTRLVASEVRFILEDCTARAMVVEASFSSLADELRQAGVLSDGIWIQMDGPPGNGFRDYESLIAHASENQPEVRVPAASPWTFIYTSGTTGQPKGVVRSHASYAVFFYLNAVELSLTQHDTGLCVMPLHHVNSVFYGFTFLFLGATLCVYDRRHFDPEDLLSSIASEGVSFSSLVPTQCVMLLDIPLPVRDRYDLRSLRQLLVSSAPARRDTKLAIMEAFPRARLFEGYGSTEAGLVTLLHPEHQLDKLGSVGREIVGTGRIRLLDSERNEVPDGEVGEIYSLTPTAFDSYWNKPELTEQAFHGRYCSAGDMAYRDEDGFITLVDRKANLIITGGEKVYPSDVETLLATHPDVQDAAVVGLSDPFWGERVTAAVVPCRGKIIDRPAVLAWAKQRLTRFKCPRELHVLRADEMPRSATGKILHRALRERLEQRSATTAGSDDPTGSLRS